MWGLSGGLRGIVFYRPVTVFRCRGGRCLASPDAFAEMQRRKVECLEYYAIYVDILARMSKRTPRSYHPFAAAGADALGVRRARGTPYGSDWVDQPHFREWLLLILGYQGADNLSVLREQGRHHPGSAPPRIVGRAHFIAV